MRKSQATRRMWALLSLMLLAAALVGGAPADRGNVYDWYAPIIDVRNLLCEHYVVPPDEANMQAAAIAGMVEAIGDPYTVYIPPSGEQAFNKELRGTYVGIGAEVNPTNDYLTVVTPMEDSPAFAAGLLPGDVILAIDGQSTYRKSVDECINMLSGEAGTATVLRVRSPDGEERDVTVQRQRIVTKTVRGVRRNGEAWDHCVDDDLGVAYVRVTQFTSSTAVELGTLLNELQLAHHFDLNALVLDLRDNPGGSLTSAVETADLFLTGGTIVTVRGREVNGEPAHEQVYHAHRPGTLPDIPMVVLINGNSASASEIVAGALQENGRAVLIGTRTHGKGSVQEVRPLPSGIGTLKLTTAQYMLPSGRTIQRFPESATWGVDPDPGFVVPVTTSETREMMTARRETEKLFGGPAARALCASVDWIRLELRDEQLALAVETLKTKLTTGAWQPIGEEDATRLAIESDLQRQLEKRGELLAQLDQTEARIRQLNMVAEAVGRVPLLPPDIDLAQGTLTIRDKLGNVVGTFRIEGGDLEQALQVVKLTPTTNE